MACPERYVDIHCHLLGGIDDGAKNLDESLAMARMAVADGIGTIVATPHQLGGFAGNDGAMIRRMVSELQSCLNQEQIPLRVLPGADVRIEPDLVARLCRGDVVSLADGPYVLLELPHEVYMPLERLLGELEAAGYRGILSHPERNLGILSQPELLPPLVRRGCLMQITAGSLLGGFGARIQGFSECLLQRGLVHFVSTDAHGTTSRRPQMRAAFERIATLAGLETALALCCRNPAGVVAGGQISKCPAIRPPALTLGGWTRWLTRGKAS